jgi:hypothetical protein
LPLSVTVLDQKPRRSRTPPERKGPSVAQQAERQLAKGRRFIVVTEEQLRKNEQPTTLILDSSYCYRLIWSGRSRWEALQRAARLEQRYT